MNFKDLVMGMKFHIRKQETYNFNDVADIEEQLKNKIVSELGRTIEDELKAKDKSILDLQTQIEGEKNKFDTLSKSKVEIEDKLKKAEDLTKEKEAVIAKYVKSEETQKAQELFGGLVASGAETDVYNILGDAIKEVEIKEEDTKEQIQEKIKPLVEGLIKTKPYFAPQDVKKVSDNKDLIIEKVAKENEEKTNKINGDSDTVAVGGMVF